MRAARLLEKAAALACLAIFFSCVSSYFVVHGQEGTRLAAVRFTGLERFSEAQVSRATGLIVGEAVAREQLGAAANRLSHSGAFDNVSFRYTTDNNQLVVEFQVTETRHLLPCRFDNFVWFSDSQLDETLRARVAFYAGAIPETGSTVDDVRAALRELIHSNGIPGDVDAVPFATALGQTVSAMSFAVKGVSLPIRTVEFPGAVGVSPGDLRAASSQMMGRDYSISSVSAFASTGLISLYRQRGYLRANFAGPHADILNRNGDGSVQEIAVTLSVEEGPQFFWGKEEWSGNQQFTAADLNHLLGMQPNEIANRLKIDAGIAAVKQAYGRRGFIDAAVKSIAKLDEGTRLASYNFAVTEGVQYHLSAVHFDGIADKAALALVKKWSLKSGDIFDAAYPADFMKQIAPQTLHDLGVAKASYEIKPQLDTQNASVDLHIVLH